jgi:GNAT superfamily N-acetyltransferase
MAVSDTRIIPAATPAQVEQARTLFREYAEATGHCECFQGFATEVAGLPGQYAPPGGQLLLLEAAGQPAGCVALRGRGDGIGEMKRLYVRPEFRGHNIGRLLAERIIREATAIGYSRMRLDTVAGKMDSAITMYRQLGFKETDPYYQTPVGHTLFMELALTREAFEKIEKSGGKTTRSAV